MFSNSLAPYLASAALSAVNYLEQNPSVLGTLRRNVALVHKGKYVPLGIFLTTFCVWYTP